MAVKKFIIPAMFREVYAKISEGTPRWNGLEVCNPSYFLLHLIYSSNNSSIVINQTIE